MEYKAKLSDIIYSYPDGLGMRLVIGDLEVHIPDRLFGKLRVSIIPNLSDFVADSDELSSWIKENWCRDCEYKSYDDEED